MIAHAGVASRRKAEELIKEGKVKVNGKVVTELGVKVTGSDQIEVNGLKVEREEPVYFLLYKPRGVISAAQDDKGRKVVTDFLKIFRSAFIRLGVWTMIRAVFCF